MCISSREPSLHKAAQLLLEVKAARLLLESGTASLRRDGCGAKLQQAGIATLQHKLP